MTITFCCHGQTRDAPHSWSATIKVVDDTGQPVPGATAWVSYYLPVFDDHSKNYAIISGTTDDHGIFTVSHNDQTARIGFHAQKDGHYPVDGAYEFGFSSNDRMINWNPAQTLHMKRIIHPIPMYAKAIAKGPPVLNQPVGYDFVNGDWVAPYGSGQSADIVFTGNLNQKAKNDFDYRLTISFPNAGDGIQRFYGEGGGVRSPYEAPADGYQPQLLRTMSRHPGKGMKEDMNDASRNYFFRVRTALDHQGNVVSAHYGKIYGDFMQFTYYLNPTPNSRNMEFDPKKNLFAGVKSFEEVTAP